MEACVCFFRNLSLSYYGDLKGYGLINDLKAMVVAGISRSYPGNQLERVGVWTLSQSKVLQDFMQEEGMASIFLLSIRLKFPKESKSQPLQHCLRKTSFVVGKDSCDSLLCVWLLKGAGVRGLVFRGSSLYLWEVEPEKVLGSLRICFCKRLGDPTSFPFIFPFPFFLFLSCFLAIRWTFLLGHILCTLLLCDL